MRWLVLLLLLPTAAAFLEDPADDVTLDHCNMTQSAATGFEAMDLRALTLSQTPSHVRFQVETTGLERQADYDAGNYFVQLWHGDTHYTLRMYQDNAGTGAIADVIVGSERTIFGPTFLQFPASVQGASIVLDMPKNQLRDNGYFPVAGHVFTDIIVRSEAHATGIYACPDDSGPAIIRDAMPDDGVGKDFDILYGGATLEGAIDFVVGRAYQFSNGEATTYAFTQDVTNLAQTSKEFTFNETGAEGWTMYRPAPITIAAGETERVTTYVQVPFNHQHGATVEGTLRVTTDGAKASAQIGVHFLEVAQPAGHHPRVYLHALAALGLNTATDAAMGAGDHILFWNTVEDDPSDHHLPISSRTEGSDLLWYGCLSPELQLGIHPDLNGTGTFTLNLDATVATTGTLTGAIGIVADGPRESVCNDAGDWIRNDILALEPTTVSINGETAISGAITALTGDPIAWAPGSDLLLELRLTPDQAPTVGGMVQLLPGSALELPLLDYSGPTPDIPEAQQEGSPGSGSSPSEDSPFVQPMLVLLVALAARRALK